jgi:hypothetical protein
MTTPQQAMKVMPYWQHKVLFWKLYLSVRHGLFLLRLFYQDEDQDQRDDSKPRPEVKWSCQPEEIVESAAHRRSYGKG